MLGVKTCRAARTCFAGRAHWRSPSQSVCAPGPARRWGMQGFALWVHAWRWCTWRASFDPQHHGGALLWRHMHMVYWAFYKDILHFLNPNTPLKNKINNWTKWQIFNWDPGIQFMSSYTTNIIIFPHLYYMRYSNWGSYRVPLVR